MSRKSTNIVHSWYVLYTKPRHENSLTQLMRQDGWTVYCPLKKTLNQWSDRKKIIQTPLFPGFIFIQCSESDRKKALQYPSAIRFLYWLKQPAVVRDQEVKSIRRWMGEYNHDEIEVKAIDSGSIVRLQAGPLMGLDGTILEWRGAQAIIVLEQMGIQVCVNTQQTPLTQILAR